jgi:hypothetical protein
MQAGTRDQNECVGLSGVNISWLPKLFNIRTYVFGLPFLRYISTTFSQFCQTFVSKLGRRHRSSPRSSSDESRAWPWHRLSRRVSKIRLRHGCRRVGLESTYFCVAHWRQRRRRVTQPNGHDQVKNFRTSFSKDIIEWGKTAVVLEKRKEMIGIVGHGEIMVVGSLTASFVVLFIADSSLIVGVVKVRER